MSVSLQARPKMGRKKRNDTAVKVDAEVVKQARHVAVARDISLAEYLTDLLKPLVASDYRSLARSMADQVDDEPSPAPKQKPKPKR